MASTVAVQGHVAAGYEPVAEELQRQFASGWHVGAGFAAYANGVKVVDIQAGDSRQADEATGVTSKPFDASTLTVRRQPLPSDHHPTDSLSLLRLAPSSLSRWLWLTL